MDKQSLAEFLALPVNPDETWQGGVATLSSLFDIPFGEASIEPALVMWRSKLSEMIHAKPMTISASGSFDEFFETMVELSTTNGFSFRPSQIDCNDPKLAEELNCHLEGSGTLVQFRATMGEWNSILNEIAEQLQEASPPAQPSLREAGCSDQQIREFAITAAEFYRAMLWEVLDDTDLIKIETPRPSKYMKYAVVLGAGAQSYGLGLYRNDEDHFALMAQEADPREMSLYSFVYESPADASPGDVDLWQELDLPLETGDAFPDPNLFLPEGPRRPTPKEIDFLTIVLKGLAQSTEEEIDSGRWTTWVKIDGKRRKCVFSIPNLLDPPDRAEWIRRGKMPDQRANEVHFRRIQQFVDEFGPEMSVEELQKAINTQFVGRSLDDYEFPRNTPTERAEALYQDALASFGRRRVQLAREALVEDAGHVEANILVAESTRDAEQRIDLFAIARRAAAEALGSDMEELAGEFWGCHETRPYMRASHGLAVAHADNGQLNDAIEIYREMLELNPNDNQGVRYEIVPLLMKQDRDVEAIEVLDQYREASALWTYMQALVLFRQGEGSSQAKRALREAFRCNDHVVKMLLANEPPLLPESYAHGSPEEAAICIEELQATWDETEGYMEWMLHEFILWERDRAKRFKDQKRKKKRQTKRKR